MVDDSWFDEYVLLAARAPEPPTAAVRPTAAERPTAAQRSSGPAVQPPTAAQRAETAEESFVLTEQDVIRGRAPVVSGHPQVGRCPSPPPHRDHPALEE